MSMKATARLSTDTTPPVRARLVGAAPFAATSAPVNAGGAAVLIIGRPDRTARLSEQIGARFGQTAVAARNGPFPAASAAAGTVHGIRPLDSGGLTQLLVAGGISEVVVDADLELDVARIASRFRGVRVRNIIDFFEDLEGKVWLEAPGNEGLLHGRDFNHSRSYRLVKRAVDIFFAFAILPIITPLLAAIAVAIKLDSSGPLLFKQERVGLNGVPFVLYKFRSMREDAEEETGPVWAEVDDERVTRVGAYLRRLHLDELPQVINVLRNELSFVGPRPERPCFVEILGARVPHYDLRHQMQPGITGWAQVNYPYADSIADGYNKLEYDLYYAKHASIAMDLWVMLRTVKSILFAEGR